MTLVPKRGSLKRRIYQASSWSLIQIVTTQGFRLLSNLVMTRLLLPEAFGLMALVAMLLSAFQLFTDIGIQRSIIRDPDGEDPHYLRVAWVVKMLRGAGIGSVVLLAALIVGLLAPQFAKEGTAYADPHLPWLIALSALAPLMDGASSTTRQLMARQLKNWRLTFVGILAQVIGIAAQIALASLYPTVWALMVGFLTINLVGLLMSHVYYPGPKMRVEWDKEIADRLWHFGKFLMASSALTFVARNADKFILASLLGTSSFGLYAIAQIWIEAGKQLIDRIRNNVGFPAISEVIRTRPDDVPRLFGKFQRVIDTFCVLACLACLLLGQTLIDLLYTDTYATAGQYLRLMGVAYLSIRYETMNQLVLNFGDSKAMMHIAAMRAVAICITLPLGYNLIGVEGAILAMALNPLVSAPYTLALLRKRMGRFWMGKQYLWLAGILATAGLAYAAY